MKHAGKRIALVTGANKGIGHEIVRGLARHGLVVLLGARNADLTWARPPLQRSHRKISKSNSSRSTFYVHRP